MNDQESKEGREARQTFLQRIGKALRPERKPFEPWKDNLPMLAQKLKQRRALIMRSKMGFPPSTIWIDDEGSCRRQPLKGEIPHHSRMVTVDLWHTYRSYSTSPRYNTGVWVKWMIRCPETMTKDEWRRVIVDIPEGSANEKFKDFLREHGEVGGKYADDERAGSRRYDHD